jgi:hypothetical protein
LCLLVGGMVLIGWRWIKYNDHALKAKREGREAEDKAEEIRLKMVNDLATQIAKLSERISDDREQDRLIREKELIAVDKLVESVENNTNLLKSHTDDSVVFRATMTTQSNAMLSLISDANKGIADNTTAINSVKTELQDVKDEFQAALIALPNTIQSILSPYCERLDMALKKLETVQVEEQQHDTHLGNPIQVTMGIHDDDLVVHPSDGQTEHHRNGADDHSHERGGDASSENGEHANDAPKADEIPDGNPASESDSGNPTSECG